MDTISWGDFERVELRIGTIIAVEEFPEARKPAWKLTVDFGEFGVKRSSAQITVHYRKEDLLGRQVLGVLNFPPKQIGPFRSEVLVTGFADEQGAIVLAMPERKVPDGARLI
ncbi:MAG TPA: tRNA-binding protein [Gemmatimonadales bacterium]|nr:tRNA-binding protein [Gemmatimonadales bacterium]